MTNRKSMMSQPSSRRRIVVVDDDHDAVTMTPSLWQKGLRLDNVCEFFTQHAYTSQEQQELWQKTLVEAEDCLRRHYTVDEPNMFMHFNSDTLAKLFDILDKHFFGSVLRRWICEDRHRKLTFTMGKKLDDTSRQALVAGHHRKRFDKGKPVEHMITMFKPAFERLFKPSQRSFVVHGMICQTRLECFMHVLAHETVHLILSVFCTGNSGHGKMFHALAKNVYGQKSASHALADMFANITLYDGDKVVEQWKARPKQTFICQFAESHRIKRKLAKIISIDELTRETTILFKRGKTKYEKTNFPLDFIMPNIPT